MIGSAMRCRAEVLVARSPVYSSVCAPGPQGTSLPSLGSR